MQLKLSDKQEIIPKGIISLAEKQVTEMDSDPYEEYIREAEPDKEHKCPASGAVSEKSVIK